MTMTLSSPNGGTSNTAIIAIVVLVLIAVVAFMFFFWRGEEPVTSPEPGPDVELQDEPPAVDDGGGEDEPQSDNAP